MKTRLKKIFDSALDCLRRGWFVFPCYPKSKAPAGKVVPHGVKDASNDESRICEWWYIDPNVNPAIALGPSNLVVYDFDEIKPFENLSTTFTVKTGRIPADGIEGIQMCFAGSTNTHGHPCGGGEVRSRGAYVMAPGSIHPSGNPYVIVADFPLAPSPEQSEEVVKPSQPAIGTDEQERKATFVEEAFKASGIRYRSRVAHEGGFMWLIICPWGLEHSEGEDFDSSSAVIMWPSGKLIYECKHKHCSGIRQWHQLRDWMQESAARFLQFGDPSADAIICETSYKPETAPTEKLAIVRDLSHKSTAPSAKSIFALPDSAMGSKVLGDIYNKLFAPSDIPLSLALPSLVTAASVLVPAPPGREFNSNPLVIYNDDDMVNLYLALILPLHGGKSQIIEWACRLVFTGKGGDRNTWKGSSDHRN